MVYLNNEETKQQLLLMLKETIDFLDANDIRYSITSGTMLGAVRHQGFIPWDDDIDIGILRPDYDRMVEILKEKKQIGQLEAIGFELGNSLFPFVKIVNPDIYVKEEGTRATQRLWIDIFPFDGMGKSVFRIKLLNTTVRPILKKLLWFANSEYYMSHPRNCRHIIWNYFWYGISKLCSPEFFIRLLIRNCSGIKVSDSIYVEDSTWGTKAVPKEVFDEMREYRFETMTVKGFKDYDTYLKCIYGDYMTLPPEEKRVNHGIKPWRVNDYEK